MAGVISEVIDGTVWLLDETVVAVFCALEGLFSVIAYLPTIVVNLFLLAKLLAAGIVNCIWLVNYTVWSTVSFLLYLPQNLALLFSSCASAVGTVLQWSFSVLHFILASLYLIGFYLWNLFKQIIFSTIDGLNRFDLIAYKPTVSLMGPLLYAIEATKWLCLSLANNCLFLISLPLRALQSSLEFLSTIVFSIPSVFISVFSHTSNFLQVHLPKPSSFFWHYSTKFDSSTPHRGENNVQFHYNGVDWLTSFSQLMLAFSIFIFVSAALVVSYHMRFKLAATFSTLMEVCTRMLSRRPRPDQHLPQRRDRRSDDDDDDDYLDGEVDLPLIVGGPSHVDNSRGASVERSAGAEPSIASAGRRSNYELLFQQERDRQLCVICQDNEKDTLLFPCKHLCACHTCVEHITSAAVLDSRRCPMCRHKISSYLDVYT